MSDARPVGAARPLRLGILGTAHINERLLPGAALVPRVEVVAVASRDAGRAAAYAREKGIPAAHGSYEALLADPSVDAVYIPLPNQLHHPWTIRALEAGKHVLCEKPYSRRPAEVEEAWGLADRHGLVLTEAFMWRHTPLVARFVAELPSIGRLRTIRSTFSFAMSKTEDVRLEPELDGGSLMDVGCYCVSGARLIAGEEPELALGIEERRPGEVDRRFTGILRFPSGVVAEFTSGFESPHRSLEAIGSAGSLAIADPWHATSPRIVRGDGSVVELDEVDPYACELEDFAAAVAGEKEPRLGRADALGQARAIAALYEAARTGSAVRV